MTHKALKKKKGYTSMPYRISIGQSSGLQRPGRIFKNWGTYRELSTFNFDKDIKNKAKPHNYHLLF